MLKNCVHWKLSTTYFSTIPADMRSNSVWLRIWLQTFPLVGVFVAYRHTLSDVNSCQIINSAVQKSGGGVESGDMTSRTCEQVWQSALALFGYTHFMRCMVGVKWWEQKENPIKWNWQLMHMMIHLQIGMPSMSILGSPLWSVARHPLQIYITWNTSHRRSTKKQNTAYSLCGNEIAV